MSGRDIIESMESASRPVVVETTATYISDDGEHVVLRTTLCCRKVIRTSTNAEYNLQCGEIDAYRKDLFIDGKPVIEAKRNSADEVL